MKKTFNRSIISLLFLSILMAPAPTTQAESFSGRLNGKILLQVETHGEAWYVNPVDSKRYYLGRPADAFSVMRQLGLGITEENFLSLTTDQKKRLSGRILIRVKNKGQAYYLNPADLKVYYLGRPADAFSVMRQLGLGISNNNLAKIAIGFLHNTTPPSTQGQSASVQGQQNNAINPSPLLAQMEQDIHSLINKERVKAGLSELKWNAEIAAVAREHSQDQADENQSLISPNRICSYPFIHHEGEVFGLYHNDRLNERRIFYFGSAAENIALIPSIKSGTYDSYNVDPVDCQDQLNKLNQLYEEKVHTAVDDNKKVSILKEEITKRAQLLDKSAIINVLDTSYHTKEEVESQTVTGWMNSPGHRKNILNGSYDEAGIGIAQVKDYYIITQVFIKRADCGYQGGNCCQKTGYYPYCYVPLTCADNNICQTK